MATTMCCKLFEAMIPSLRNRRNTSTKNEKKKKVGCLLESWLQQRVKGSKLNYFIMSKLLDGLIDWLLQKKKKNEVKRSSSKKWLSFSTSFSDLILTAGSINISNGKQHSIFSSRNMKSQKNISNKSLAMITKRKSQVSRGPWVARNVWRGPVNFEG